ncbi:phage holin family protein [Bacillus bombysepticus]|nr:phage holin family protein [Bacillus bombysepticus]
MNSTLMRENLFSYEIDFDENGTIRPKETSPSPEENSTRVSAKNISNIVIAAGLFLSYYSNSTSKPYSPINQINSEIDGIIKKIDGLPSTNQEFNFISHNQHLNNRLPKNINNLNLNTGSQSMYTEISFSSGAGKTSHLISIINAQLEHQEALNIKFIGQDIDTVMQNHNYVPLSKNILKYTHDFTNTSASNNEEAHNLVNKSLKNGGSGMRNVAAGFPLLELKEIKQYFSTFIEAPSNKVFFALMGSALTLIFGSFSILHWLLIVMTVFHFLLRVWANKHKNEDNYVNFQKNIQKFIWPYIVLAVSNALTKVLSIDGLPDGTLFSLIILWLVWGELKGFIENAEICGLSVPPILKKYVSGNSNDRDLPF